ncbi:MAG: hypothetical protein V4677_04490 [Bacteroidota bacterium]
MAVTLMVKIKVENFEHWKKTYDEADEFRKKMGIVVKGIYQSIDDDKNITLISDYPSLEMAKGMLANPVWEENQRKAGVIGGFDISFYNEIG